MKQIGLCSDDFVFVQYQSGRQVPGPVRERYLPSRGACVCCVCSVVVIKHEHLCSVVVIKFDHLAIS